MAPRDTRKLGVVLCDDDRALLRMLTRALPARGTEVLGVAESFEELRELLGRTRPDVIVLDVNLPGVNGIEGLEALNHERVAIPVVIMSADRRYQAAAEAAGAASFVYKGALRLSELVESIHRAVAR
jgi:DNA-binding NarL/FixJ family response regulator